MPVTQVNSLEMLANQKRQEGTAQVVRGLQQLVRAARIDLPCVGNVSLVAKTIDNLRETEREREPE
jgi:hypothetical protein